MVAAICRDLHCFKSQSLKNGGYSAGDPCDFKWSGHSPPQLGGLCVGLSASLLLRMVQVEETGCNHATCVLAHFLVTVIPTEILFNIYASDDPGARISQPKTDCCATDCRAPPCLMAVKPSGTKNG